MSQKTWPRYASPVKARAPIDTWAIVRVGSADQVIAGEAQRSLSDRITFDDDIAGGPALGPGAGVGLG